MEGLSAADDHSYAQLCRALAVHDVRADLPYITTPILLIAGERDTVGRPDAMQRMFAQVPGSEFACIANAAHYGFAEQPDEFKRLVLDFVARRVPG